MQKRGINRGAHVVFQLSDNANFLSCFWSCVLGGLIPIPLPVCSDEEKQQKLLNVLSKLENPCVIADARVEKAVSAAIAVSKRVHDVTFLLFDKLSAEKDFGEEYENISSDIAMIQFSSGSTGQPKGVMLTHKNIISNVHSIVGAAGFDAQDTVLSWLPLTHDMGLIGAHLSAVLLQVDQYIMPTELFIRRPALWFDKISEHRVTVTLAPNFAYKYILSLLKNGMKFQWNLSRLRFILNGAEPISADVCNQFVHEMGVYGLRDDTILNVYGMAEASLAVSFSAPHEKLGYTFFDRNSLSIGDRVVLQKQREQSVAIVNVGTAVPECSIRIADENNCVLENGVVGEIQLFGPHITCGYYKGGEMNANLFSQDGWLHTGDVGFIYDGKLFISGRLKEIMFVNGQNYYPYDIEESIENLMALPAGSVAVCGVPDSKLERDRVCLFVERINDRELGKFTSEVREKLMQYMKLYIDIVVPMKKLPRTNSGKIQRVILKKRIEDFETASAPANGSASNLQIPVTETEVLLIELCKTCLPNGDELYISRNASFMEMGLDSVMLLNLAEKITKHFHKEVGVTKLFANPTICKLASYLDGKKTAQMPEIFFERYNRERKFGNFSDCVYFAISGDNTFLQNNLPETLSSAIQRIHPDQIYSFHCMCRTPELIEHYLHDGSGLSYQGSIHLDNLVNAKCGNQSAYKCILFDSELNRSNHNMAREYDIAIEYQVQSDKMLFYCYRSAYTEEELLFTLADELEDCLIAQIRKEATYV